MKKICMVMVLILGGVLAHNRVMGQANEIAQLALNIEKLNQFKQILKDMKSGYDLLEKGYGTIKNISQGNFSMHQVFLDGLYQVSPTVQKYGRIADIVSGQVLLVKEYKDAFSRFKKGGMFQTGELQYMGAVYERLMSASIRNLEELTNIVTASKLRMSDDERIKSIDRIHADMQDKLRFLRSFNNSTAILALQRKRTATENQVLQQSYGIN